MSETRLLDRKKVENILALTSAQEGILFEYIQDSESERYFEQLVLQITGSLNEANFSQAWEYVISTNEALRSTFRWEQMKKPFQIVLKDMELNRMICDVSQVTEEKKSIELEKMMLADRQNLFDLNKTPFRITLCRMSQEKHVVLISYHHILFDGWSLGVLLREFFTAYRLLNEGQNLPNPTRGGLKEYLRWVQTQDKSQGEAYWKEYLAGYEPKNVSMGRDDRRGSGQGKTYACIVSEEVVQAIENYVKTNKTTMSALFFTVWGILLHYYLKKDDVVYGYAVSGRNTEIPEIENLVGMLMNTLPMRSTICRDTRFEELLNDTATALQGSEKYQYTPLSRIKSLCGTGVGNLFNAVIGFENYPLDKVLLESGTDLTVTDFSFHEMPNFDLAVTVTAFAGVRLDFLYNTAAFCSEEMERMAGHFSNLLESVIRSPEAVIDTFDPVTPRERAEILSLFNQPMMKCFHNGTLIDLFTEQVQRNSAKIAVTCEGESLTYHQLNVLTNQLARRLRKKGIGPDQIVGIMAERSVQLIIGILAIVKAGGAYLPLETSFPEERLRFMLSDSGAKILLTTANLLNDLEQEIIDLDACFSLNEDGSDLSLGLSSENLAYIIYTSGSTGVPKGVMVEHRNAVSLFSNCRLFDLTGDDVWSLFHSCAFDFSVWEMFGAFLSGSKLVIVPKELTVDIQKYYELLERENITILNQTPAVFYNLITEDIKSGKRLKVRCVFLGGEALTFGRLQPWKEKYPETRLINLYGATENTVFTAYKEITDQDLLLNISNIGKPIPTMQIYILDQQNRLLPVGVPGELCISGYGLVRGYLNRPDLTREKFVDNPFIPGERMYRTGDLVRWLPDGNLEFLTRIDQQVKIRGYRIETGEVEYQLLQYPGIRGAAVIARNDEKGNPFLVGYFVAGTQIQIQIAELRGFLSQVLPDYMVPGSFVQLETLPVTSNGKLNHKALLSLSHSLPEERDKVFPRDEVEARLAAIWKEVLDLSEVPGVFDSFFEVGGHSLNALQVIGSIQHEFGVKLTIQQYFQNPDIAALTQCIRDAQKVEYHGIERTEKQPYYPLSFHQKRLWTVHQIEPDSLSYNISGKITLQQRVDFAAVNKAIQMLVARHESLRTWFGRTDQGPIQIVEDILEVPVKMVDLSALPHMDREEQREHVYHEELRTRFDLAKLPLIKVTLVKVAEEEWDLLFSMHHIISDGWSVEILKREFTELYDHICDGRESSLEALPIQYRDFAIWQNRQFAQPDPNHPSYRYWKAQLEEGFPVMELPYDFPGTEKSKANAGYRVLLGEETKKGLHMLTRRLHLTLFTVMFSAFNLLLAKLSGQKEVVCGVPSAGREQRECKDLVGFFVNSVLLKTHIDFKESFLTLCQRVNRESSEAFEHQRCPLELVLDELKMRYPDVQVFFNLLNLPNGVATEELHDLVPYHFRTVQDAKFDFILYISEYKNGIEIVANYRSGLFKPDTVEYILGEYKKILDFFIRDPEAVFDDFRQSNKKKIF